MATIKWLGGNGNWTTATDWNPNSVPGATDDAVIDASGSYTVTISAAISVGSITVNGSSATLFVNDTGQSITVAGSLTISNGSLRVDTNGGQGGTSVSIGGTLTNDGFMQIGNTSLSAATMVTAAGLSLSGNSTTDLYGSATKQAVLDITAAAPTTLTGTLNLFNGQTLVEFASGGHDPDRYLRAHG
jgi:hypothetical protein